MPGTNLKFPEVRQLRSREDWPERSRLSLAVEENMPSTLDEQLTRCDREPIHLIPSIQDTGAVIVVRVEGEDLLRAKIIQVSTNINSFGFPQHEEALRSDLFSLFRTHDKVKKILEEALEKAEKFQLKSSSTVHVDGKMFTDEPRDWWDKGFSKEDCTSFVANCKTQCYSDLRTASDVILLANGSPLVCTAFKVEHSGAALVVLEFETAQEIFTSTEETFRFNQTLNTIFTKFSSGNSSQEVFDLAAKVVRDVCKYDRVMVYQFEGGDGRGKIVSESTSQELNLDEHGSFLGMNFPGSDIPKQARSLYIRNRIRFIADVNAEPVPLTPATIDGKPLDMSDSRLRQVSPYHIQYLKNMRVRASASASIVVEGELWGLIACHSYSNTNELHFIRRLCLSALSSLLQNSIEAQVNRQRQDLLSDVHRSTLGLECSDRKIGDFIESISQDLLQIFSCDAILLASYEAEFTDANEKDKDMASEYLNPSLRANMFDTSFSDLKLSLTNLQIHGSSFDPKFVHRAAMELLERCRVTGEIPCTSSIKKDLPHLFAEYQCLQGHKIPCGIAVAKCLAYDLVFIRGEAEENVIWAGKEGFEIAHGDKTKALNPRHSFTAYNESIRNRAMPWIKIEIEGMKLARMRLLAAAERLHLTNAFTNYRISKMASMFLAHMSHELRTPFNGIVGMLSVLLEDQDLPSYAKEMLSTVNRSAEAMLDILDDILTVSRLEEGKMALKNSAFSCSNLLQDVEKLFKVRSEKLGVALRSTVGGPAADELFGDAGRIRQILLNLAGNAFRFVPRENGVIDIHCDVFSTLSDAMEAISETSQCHTHSSTPMGEIFNQFLPRPTVSVAAVLESNGFEKKQTSSIISSETQSDTKVDSLQAIPSNSDVAEKRGSKRKFETHSFTKEMEERIATVDASGRKWLLVTVKDNGIGVEKEGLGLLFRKFSQIDSSEKKQYQGTGLGLSICSHLCRLMGGGIWCFSTTKSSILDGPLPKRFCSHTTASHPPELHTGATFQFMIPLDAATLLRPGTPMDMGDESCDQLRTSTFEDLGGARLEQSGAEGDEKNPPSLPPDISVALESGKSVIIAADDNLINRKVLASIFSKWIPEFHLVVFEGGAEALEAVPHFDGQIAAVILDHHMPQMSGIEAGKRIRSMLPAATPVYILTADCSISNKVIGEHGLSGVIHKPVTVKRIREELQSVLDSVRGENQNHNAN